MFTKNNKLICDICNKFCSYFDEWTPFGCSSYDPPEPFEPSHICKKCFPKVKKEWIKEFKNGCRNGDYQKSRAEMEAANECGLKWVSNGVGVLGTEEYADSYQYISKKDYNRLNKLPYWGYCEICGNRREGGYCSNKKCYKSFQSKIKPYSPAKS